MDRERDSKRERKRGRKKEKEGEVVIESKRGIEMQREI